MAAPGSCQIIEVSVFVKSQGIDLAEFVQPCWPAGDMMGNGTPIPVDEAVHH